MVKAATEVVTGLHLKRYDSAFAGIDIVFCASQEYFDGYSSGIFESAGALICVQGGDTRGAGMALD